MPTLFDHAGGEEAIHRLEDTFYRSVLADPVLAPLFGSGRETHVDHRTAFTAESIGGPDRFTREGSAHLIEVHRCLAVDRLTRDLALDLVHAEVLDAGAVTARHRVRQPA